MTVWNAWPMPAYPPTFADDVIQQPARAQFEAFLNEHRVALNGCLDGLSEEQARRSLVASRTTLLGLVKHAIFVEKVWFHVSLGGQTREELGLPNHPNESFVLDDSDTIESVLAGYRQAWAEADEIAAAYELDDLAQHNRRGPLTLRWIYVHLVEELARHAGHGDILREQVLASG